MVFHVVLSGLVLQLHEAWDQVEMVNQELHCQSLIHSLGLDEHLKLVVEKQKEHFLMV